MHKKGNNNVGGVTISTRDEEITAVNSTKWSNHPLTELYDQLYTLRERLDVVTRMGKVEMAAQITNGITIIQTQIDQLSNIEDT